MALEERTGNFGTYWGDTFDSSHYLDHSKQEINAQYIWASLSNSGWSLNAVSAMLGNMETESSINPGRWEGDSVGGDPTAHGYGLVQWTPYTKYTEWSPVTSDPSTMDNNLLRINYEVQNEIQWIPTQTYNFTFEEFKTSEDTAYNLALAFLANYERPADPNQPQRGLQAEAWFEFLGGIPPTPTRTKTNYWKFRRKGTIIL